MKVLRVSFQFVAAVILSLFSMGGVSNAATDHSALMKGPFKNGEEVTKACLECHEKEADAVMQTPHYRWKGVPRTVKGLENSKEEYGKANLINNFCTSVEGGSIQFCDKCHPSYGWVDKSFNFKDKTKIDCLVCHAKAGNYRKGPTGEPDKALLEHGKMDLVKAAQSVSLPNRDNCGSCHFNGGGADAVKHGDLDTTLSKPTHDHDVHMSKPVDMPCQGCHVAKDHKIAGASTFMATNDGRVSCEDCHRDPHKNTEVAKVLARHTKTVACQTCHIPAFARGQATKMSWDWSTAGKDNVEPEEQFGKENYMKIKGTFVWGKDIVPAYTWYDGKIERYLKGQKIADPKKTTYISKPAGDIKDPNSKIFPFKIHTGKQPMDSENKYLSIFQNYDGFWKHFDWQKALTDGSKASGLAFSGKFEFVPTAVYGSINHEVAPKEQALKCGDCHFDGKRLDWKALGYAGDPMRVGGRFAGQKGKEKNKKAEEKPETPSKKIAKT